MHCVNKDSGIVLREMDSGESSKKLIMLTRNHGKVVVFARGAKGAKSKLAVPRLAYCEFVFYDGGKFLSLTQVSPVMHFGNIPQNYDAYCVAAFVLELADKMLFDNMEATDALKLVLAALLRLDRGGEPALVHGAFTVKMLQNEGFFALEDTQSRELCPNVLAAIKYILDAPIEKVFAFRASDDVLVALRRVALDLLRENVDIHLKSVEFT